MNQLQSSIVLCANIVLAASVLAQPSPDLLPFQGRLSGANGQVVPDGAKLVQFRIYDAPVGGTAVWQGEVHKLSVNSGLVSTLLGSKATLRGIDFDRVLYLEITADANADDSITPADPPLLPRQVLLPTVFARESANSRKLEGYGWGDLLAGGSSNPSTGQIADSKLSPGIFVPVGAVIMWWGSVNQIPTNFELCNGATPTTPGALLQGNKPDLRDKFVKGATTGATTLGQLSSGGSHTIAQRDSGGTILTVNQLPSHLHGSGSLVTSTAGAHTHQIRGPYSSSEGGDGTTSVLTDDQNFGSLTFPISASSAGSHFHSISGTTSAAGNNETHSHSIAAHDNRPAYQELFYIIRVK